MVKESIALKAEDRQGVDKVQNEFWNQASGAENIALFSKIARLKEMGIDVEGLLALIDTGVAAENPSKPADKAF